MSMSSKCTLLLVIVALALCEENQGTGTDPVQSFLAYDFLYNEGVNMYLQDNWEECVRNLQLALKGWHYWNDNTARCRKNCHRETGQKELLSAHLSEEDRYFERILHNTHCIIKCKRDAFGAQQDRIIESNVIDAFKMRKPYDYLQLCYFKLGRMKDAADSAATVLAVQPEHTVMSDNLKYYLEEGGIQPENVLNLEMKPYGQEYMKGTLAYQENNFEQTIVHMEKSLKLFFEEYHNCRFLCQNPFDQGWFPDFVSSIANHFTFTLRCKRKCLWQLSDLFGDIDDSFLPSYFDYLQYSYFQMEEPRKACEAVASYLILQPEDKVQKSNKEFYLSLDEVTEDMFAPRKEIVAFKDQEDYEEKLLELIETNFAFLTDELWDEEDETSEGEKVGDEGQVSNTTTSTSDLDTNSVVLGTVETLNEEL